MHLLSTFKVKYIFIFRNSLSHTTYDFVIIISVNALHHDVLLKHYEYDEYTNDSTRTIMHGRIIAPDASDSTKFKMSSLYSYLSCLTSTIYVYCDKIINESK